MHNFAKIFLLSLLCLVSCFFIAYPYTVTDLHVDSFNYYGLVRDVFLNGGKYFDWDSSPGTNLFEFRYLYSYLIGIFSYSSHILYFSVANLSEVLFFLFAFSGFLSLVDRANSFDHKPYIYLAPAFLFIWLIVGTPFLFFSNMFLITIDIFILVFVGLFINILSYYNECKRLPLFQMSIFILSGFYLSATNLRFASSGLVDCFGFLSLLFLVSRNFRKKSGDPRSNVYKNADNIDNPVKQSINFNLDNLFPQINNKTFYLFIFILVMLIGIGYISFFSLETYSSTRRYVHLYATFNLDQQPFFMFSLFFTNMFSSLSNFIISIIYLSMLLFGSLIWWILIFGKNEPSSHRLVVSCPLTAFFSAFAFMAFIIVIILGLIQGGIHFWSDDKTRYLEVSIVFIYIAFSVLFVEKITFLRKNSFTIALLVLIIGFIYSAYHFMHNHSKVIKPSFDLYSCVKSYQKQYNLHDGINTNPDVGRRLRAYGDKTSGLNMHMIGDNPPMVDAFWGNSLYQPIENINYLIYLNKDEKYNSGALALLNGMVPDAKTTPLNCGDGESGATILVLDDKSANTVTQIFRQYAINARSYFTITNYGWEQSIWKRVPWHQKYISENHSFYYSGVMLQKTNQQISYRNNDDLSVTASSIPPGQMPIFSSGYLYVGNSKFTTTLSYSAGQNLILAAVNLQTGSVIKAWNVPATFGGAINSISEDFSVNVNSPMAIMVVSANNTGLVTVKDLTLSWDGFND